MDIGLLSETFTLPSGLEAKIREMSGREEDLLMNKKVVKSGKVTQKLLSNLVLELDGEKPTSRDLLGMYSADRTAALIHSRVLTFGPELVGEHECSNEDCRTRITIKQNLKHDLEYAERPEELEPTVELPGGNIATIRPLTGKDEEKLLRARQKGQLMTEILFLRVKEFEGIESRQELRTFLQEGSLRIRRALREAMEDLEFGYRTQEEIECPVCGNVDAVDVTSLPGFFFPDTESEGL